MTSLQLSDCILFLAVRTESDGKLNRGLATRLQFCESYVLRKSLIYITARVHVCVSRASHLYVAVEAFATGNKIFDSHKVCLVA